MSQIGARQDVPNLADLPSGMQLRRCPAAKETLGERPKGVRADVALVSGG
ncbi:hypothetical protein [Salibacterium qingdaonense]|nr:hypothetical protein [Salibacterium qingdaonense]